jgi:DNA-binding winged helix-turn-helix (wHTH) protein
MRLLLCLAEHAGQVASVEQLLDQVWAGVVITSDSVYRDPKALRSDRSRHQQELEAW